MKIGIDEFYHHGIQGQKWGVQNGPPYPLDWNDHSAKEKREMKKEAEGFEKKLNDSEKEYAKKSVSARFNKQKADYYNEKAYRKDKKGQKNDKLINRAEQYYEAYKQDMSEVKKIEQYTNSVIKEITDKGYGLYSSLDFYNPNKSKTMGLGAAFGGVVAVNSTMNNSEYINKFRVVTGDVKEKKIKVKEKNTPLHEYHWERR